MTSTYNRSTEDGWTHIYEPGTTDLTLLLLHGTGGDETSLMEFGRQVAPTANLLSVQGRSREEGITRFFRRFDALTYDQPHVEQEADALAQFVRDASARYDLDPNRVVLFGYSNGANIGFASLTRNPDIYAGIVQLRPVMVFEPENTPKNDLSGKHALVLLGVQDRFLPPGEPVPAYLREQGAIVQEERLSAGHRLVEADREISRNWLEELAEKLSSL